MNSNSTKTTVLYSALALALAISLCSPARSDDSAGDEFGSPADLRIEIRAQKQFFKIDEPYYVTVVFRNDTDRPVACEKTFDFLAGINIKQPPGGFSKKARRVRRREKPLIVVPGAFVGKRIDLAAHFPSLRAPGRYEIFWKDPSIGESSAVPIEVVEYVLLVTNYGNVSMRLLPGIAPKTVEEFKRRVRRKFYDGGGVFDIHPESLVLFGPRADIPPLDKLEAEFAGLDLVAGCVAIARKPDKKSLAGNRPERKEFLADTGSSFFIQVMPLASGTAEQYTVFAMVLEGMDVVYAISNARLRRDAQGLLMRGPDISIHIERAVVVDEFSDLIPRPQAEYGKGKKPVISFSLHPRLPMASCGTPIHLELNIVNETDYPLAIPAGLALASGLRVEMVTAEKDAAPPPAAAKERRRLELVPTTPSYPLPQASARLEPGGILGIFVDIAGLCREFSQSGRFEISWESGSLKSSKVVLNLRKNIFALIDTNKGKMRAVLYENEAPRNVARFVELARSGFYNGKPFHHSADNKEASLIQTGSPTATGTGRTEITLPLESGTRALKTGAIVMARTSNPDSANCQIFIIKNISSRMAQQWGGKYTIIGQVISETVPRGRRGRPPGRDGEAPAGRPGIARHDGIEVLKKLVKNDTVNKITIYDKPPIDE